MAVMLILMIEKYRVYVNGMFDLCNKCHKNLLISSEVTKRGHDI